MIYIYAGMGLILVYTHYKAYIVGRGEARKEMALEALKRVKKAKKVHNETNAMSYYALNKWMRDNANK